MADAAAMIERCRRHQQGSVPEIQWDREGLRSVAESIPAPASCFLLDPADHGFAGSVPLPEEDSEGA